MAGEAANTRPSREAKTIERFVPPSGPVKEKTAVATAKGSGDKLGDIEVISDRLKVLPSDHDLLKAFHSILYGSLGKASTRKKDIRAFNGFPEGEPSVDTRVEKLVEKKSIWTVAALKDLSQLLGLEKSGDRETLCKRIITFLESPSADDVKGGGKKRKLSGSKGGKKKTKGEKGKKKKSTRGPSAFILFSQDKRSEVLKKKPNLTFGEVGAELGKLWRAASGAVKKKYEDLAAKKKAELKDAEENEEEEVEEEAEEQEEEEEEGEEEADKDDNEEEGDDAKDAGDAEEEEEEQPAKKKEPAKKKAKK